MIFFHKLKLKRLVSCFCCFVLLTFLLNCSLLHCFADELAEGSLLECDYKHSYQPLHVALLMDSSGSIASNTVNTPSDPQLYSRDLAKVVTENLPMSTENQVALFQYNTNCTMMADLTPLDSHASIAKLNTILDSMNVTEGDTYMLSAVEMVVDYLKQHHDPKTQDVIILFTDGAENEGIDPETVEVNDEFRASIQKRIQSAIGDSDVIVYAVASDYMDGDVHSITDGSGTSEGYGEVILKELTEATGGEVHLSPNSVRELNQSFTQTVNTMCFRTPKPVSINDGTFHVDSSVVEVNLRIFSDDEGDIMNSPLRLKKPGGEILELDENMRGEQGILFFADRLAVNIKILKPEKGEWHLDLSALPDKQNVEISVMEQYDLGLSVRCDENKDSLYVGEDLTIHATLLTGKIPVQESALYQTSHAKMFLVSGDIEIIPSSLTKERFEEVMASHNAKCWDMELGDLEFQKKIQMESEGKQILGIWIDSPNFMSMLYEYPLNIAKKPLQLSSEIPHQSVMNGEDPLICSDLHDYCNIKDAVIQVQFADPNLVNAEMLPDGDSLRLTPVAPGSGTVKLLYTEPNGGNSAEMAFKIDVVNSPPRFVKKPEALEVGVDQTIKLENLSQYVEDYENDHLHFEVNLEKNGVVNVFVDNSNGGTLIVNGFFHGDEVIRLTVDDGNSVYDSVTIPVLVPRNTLKSIIWIVIAILGITVAVLIVLRGLRRHHTTLNNLTLCFDHKHSILLFNNYNLPQIYRKNEKSKSVSVAEVLKDAEKNSTLIVKDDRAIIEQNQDLYNKMCTALESFRIEGTIRSSKGYDILNGSNKYIEVNESRVPVQIKMSNRSNQQTISFQYIPEDPYDQAFVEFRFSFGSNGFDNPPVDNGSSGVDDAPSISPFDSDDSDSLTM